MGRVARGWRCLVWAAAAGASGCSREARHAITVAPDTAQALPASRAAAPPSLESLPPAVAAPPGSRGNPSAGRLIYATYCVHCHGMRGAGDGRLARSLSPPPADLRSLDLPGRASRVFAILKAGVPAARGAFMPHWGPLLTDQQLWDVTAYLSALAVSR